MPSFLQDFHQPSQFISDLSLVLCKAVYLSTALFALVKPE